MKSTLTVATKQVAKSTASQGTPNNSSMTRRVVNRDLWSRAVVLAAAVGLLYYLRTLVHDELQSDNNEDGLNRAYTVYACELLLLMGIGVLWRR